MADIRVAQGRRGTSKVLKWARVDAEPHGRFLAVHRTVGGKGKTKDWTVTHVPSGLAFAACFPSRRVARDVASQLRELDLDWADPKGAEWQAIRPKAGEIVQAALYRETGFGGMVGAWA